MRPHRPQPQPGFSDEEIAEQIAEFEKRKKIEQVDAGKQKLPAAVSLHICNDQSWQRRLEADALARQRGGAKRGNQLRKTKPKTGGNHE